ncbi:MAG TPA: phosphoglycerate kinase [Candidatus Babeliales bacterium]|nr:phosphoglycerate kinase [Candidatus Babeliales bacterium]
MTKQILLSTLPTWNITNKRVFLRADLNVPLQAGIILDDYRLRALLPTINLIQKNGGKIILATHIGRPKNREPNLSTRHLIPWFTNEGYAIDFEPTLSAATEKSHIDQNRILLLENLRFFPEEKSSDLHFAQQLATLGDYYVNDAFATLHRNDTSITLLPTLYPDSHRTIGLLVEHELKALNTLLYNHTKPFVFILGGGKVSDKIPLLHGMLDAIDTLLLCPAIVFSFLKAQKKSVGNSLVADSDLSACEEILTMAQDKNIKVYFPQDYQIAQGSFNGALSFIDSDTIPTNDVGISIGPKTIATYSKEIHTAGTIFYNGLMGSMQRKETTTGSQAIFNAMAQSNGFSVIGGGDSIAAVYASNLQSSIDFLSTGGGATITYLAQHDLPGLYCFLKK